jgi:hypothetical protein
MVPYCSSRVLATSPLNLTFRSIKAVRCEKAMSSGGPSRTSAFHSFGWCRAEAKFAAWSVLLRALARRQMASVLPPIFTAFIRKNTYALGIDGDAHYMQFMRKERVLWEVRLRRASAVLVGWVYALDEKTAREAALKALTVTPTVQNRLLIRRSA